MNSVILFKQFKEDLDLINFVINGTHDKNLPLIYTVLLENSNSYFYIFRKYLSLHPNLTYLSEYTDHSLIFNICDKYPEAVLQTIEEMESGIIKVEEEGSSFEYLVELLNDIHKTAIELTDIRSKTLTE